MDSILRCLLVLLAGSPAEPPMSRGAAAGTNGSFSAVPEHLTMPSSDHAARATLLALRAVAGQSGSSLRYRILPSERPVPESVAVAHLVSIPKPVFCSATSTGDTLALECLPLLPGAELEGFRKFAAERVSTLVAAVYKVTPPTTANPVALLESEREEMLLDLEALQDWLDAYDITDYFLSVMPPSDRAVRAGATATIRVGRWPDG
jgi:hypothetical protein